MNLKRHGRWISDSIAEEYVRNSKRKKSSIADRLASKQDSEDNSIEKTGK